jgi:NADPH:quinone reductase-like Zn-dependent oxidoreductase
MSTTNQSAFLDKPGTPFRITSSPIPNPGPDDIVVKNHALAINPIDHAQAASGFLIKPDSYPVVLGSDVAGEVHAVGSNVSKFKPSDRVAGHCWFFSTQKAQDGAFQLYTQVPAKNAALIPEKVEFKDGAVLPLAVDTASAGLHKVLGLPYPALDAKKSGKVLLVYGASSSVGCLAAQLAVNAGIRVLATASPRNHDFVKSLGADGVFDYKSNTLVDDIVKAAGSDEFVGIYDAIAVESSFAHDKAILEKLGSGALAATHQIPKDWPEKIKASFVVGIGEFTFPIWEKFITPALEQGKLKCLPQAVVVGKGLESVQAGLDKSKAGVSAQKVVVEL